MESNTRIPTLSFDRSFHGPLLNGTKLASARLMPLVKMGECFRAFGQTFIVTSVHRVTLAEVANSFYRAEGFRSSADFISTWRRLYPTEGYRPQQIVYLHIFHKVEDLNEYYVKNGYLPQGLIDEVSKYSR